MSHPPDDPRPAGRSVFDVGPPRHDEAPTGSAEGPPDRCASARAASRSWRTLAAPAAGVIWLASGLLSMLSFAFVVLPALDPTSGFDPLRAPIESFLRIGLATAFGIPVGLMLVWSGWRTVSGRARDTLLNAIGSFGLALSTLGLGVVIAVRFGLTEARWTLPATAAMAIAGVLAISGRGAYLAARAARSA